jgi:hypothetical protein
MKNCFRSFFHKKSKIGRENAILTFVFSGGKKEKESEEGIEKIC